jgi:hypothetical protein
MCSAGWQGMDCAQPFSVPGAAVISLYRLVEKVKLLILHIHINRLIIFDDYDMFWRGSSDDNRRRAVRIITEEQQR